MSSLHQTLEVAVTGGRKITALQEEGMKSYGPTVFAILLMSCSPLLRSQEQSPTPQPEGHAPGVSAADRGREQSSGAHERIEISKTTTIQLCLGSRA